MNSKKIVSAQVVLTAAGGARPGPQTRITSENIREWAPSAETIVRVSGELRGMGFTVGECVGNSMLDHRRRAAFRVVLPHEAARNRRQRAVRGRWL